MTVYERPFGRYFEDFEPGDVYRHWPGKTVTEYDDHLFCMITRDGSGTVQPDEPEWGGSVSRRDDRAASFSGPSQPRPWCSLD